MSKLVPPNRVAAAVALCGLLVGAAAPAVADGETVYDEAFCGAAHGSPRPSFDLTDLVGLLQAVGTYAANPAMLFYAPPADLDPWTNWYLEEDIKDQLAKLAVMRGILDKFNLWDMYLGWFPGLGSGDACSDADASVRRLDGTCNDLDRPAMGKKGYRFGRNIMPLQPAAFPNPATMMSPNPRDVSRELFSRNGDFKGVPFLNLLAASWIQFQVHDWFNHEHDTEGYWQIPLAADDPLSNGGARSAMLVSKTKLSETPDDLSPQQLFLENQLPPRYDNEVTHWWDGSQIYGSDKATSDRLRSFKGGRLKVKKGLLPKARDGFEDTGFRDNWWLGLGLMHNLFALEHNAIAEMLAEEYPTWNDQQLFDTARMINAALIVKIHTIEWTPAILPNPALEVGMNANWRGLRQYFTNPDDPRIDAIVPPELSSVVDGVAGNDRDLKQYATSAELQAAAGIPAAQADQIAGLYNGDVPYSLTEEFVSVYRMHTLLPDSIEISYEACADEDEKNESKKSKKKSKKSEKSEKDPKPKKKEECKKHETPIQATTSVSLAGTRDGDARKLIEKYGLEQLIHSFGTQHPGGLVLGNYPELLQNIEIPVLGPLDIGAVDILRDRERGVPRYNEFRRQLNLRPLASIDELTPDEALRAKLKAVYPGGIEQVDALVGTLAEGTRPTCYGFGETLFQVFTLMATRRIQADRFYTDDFNHHVYTEVGMDWIRDNGMKSVLLRHFPELAHTGLSNVTNAFYPW